MARRGRNEKDTCREYVLPALESAGWHHEQIEPEYRITDGRVVLRNRPGREEQVRADYALEITPGFPLAVVEAKREYARPSDGLQQAKDYAEFLDLPVALATNGHGIVEFDFRTGRESTLGVFPRPDELWERYRVWKGIVDDPVAEVLREPFNAALRNADGTAKEPRYYQRIAIHRAVAATLTGRRRMLLTMATGTGKTFTALQIVWKVWRYWQARSESGTRRVLYLADRDKLIDDPLQKYFKRVFDTSVHRIRGESTTSRSIYFATYQALDDSSPSPRYWDYPPGYFDLIIVDECHRGSARADSSWRQILEHFAPAAQLGLTATPKRDDNVDTYRYFGDPLYSYTLRQGINDGFLAPYRVRRVVLSPDAHGWRPDPGQLDRFRREIPDELYATSDFERVVSLLTRTEAAGRYLTDYLVATDRMAKMVIFCVDSEHAADMRAAMANANADIGRQHPDYTVRIVSAEGDRGRAQLERFQDEETSTPVVVTTAKLLSTGVDIPTLRTVVLFKPIRSMVEFKQIIGRGSRLAPDFDKLAFEIIDFTGATRLFEDPDFDGAAEREVDERVDERGRVVEDAEARDQAVGGDSAGDDPAHAEHEADAVPPHARKFYVDDTEVYLTADAVYLTDPDTDRLRLVEYTDYVAESVRRLFPTPAGLRRGWREAGSRAEIAENLARRGIDLVELSERAGLSDVDAFDVLVHVAWNEPVLTRHERVRRVRRDQGDFFGRYRPAAREVLDLLLERYAEHGIDDLADLRALELEPVNELGTAVQIAGRFDTTARLHAAIAELQRHLYAA
ncbi:MAG TPA: DEAD/DEAH box helicase family protein [Mycobacteriales bacterium]|nr:DEAD/DEAH box helicase family protein [Mycobacteriales bacterium]